MPLIKQREIPKPLFLTITPLVTFLVNIKINAPDSPQTTPITFLKVRGSFKNMAAIIMVKIGVILTIIEALVGVVLLSPRMNANKLKTIPNKEATQSRKISFLSVLGVLNTKDASQNNTAQPANLNVLKMLGPTTLRASFANGVFIPKMILVRRITI